MMRGESDNKRTGDQPEIRKPVRRMEIGNDRSIALSELVRLYTGNSQFLSDVSEIDDKLQPYRSSIDWDAVHEGHSILGDALKHPEYQDLFVRVTEAWKRDWEALRSVLPDSTRSEVEGLASKWGLRSSWGCGLVTNQSLLIQVKGTEGNGVPGILFNEFALGDGYTVQRYRFVFELETHMTEKGIRTRFREGEREAIQELRRRQRILASQGYRLGSKRPTGGQRIKELSTQILWLYQHITPPYMSVDEISFNDPDRPGQLYIQRRYQKIAKMLEIRLPKGWRKWRKRNPEERRQFREEVIKTNFK